MTLAGWEEGPGRREVLKYRGIIWELEYGIVLGMLGPPGITHQKGWGGTEHSRWGLLTPNLAWAGPAPHPLTFTPLTLTVSSLRNLAGKR